MGILKKITGEIVNEFKGSIKTLHEDIYRPIFVDNNPLLKGFADDRKKKKEKDEAKQAGGAQEKWQNEQREAWEYQAALTTESIKQSQKTNELLEDLIKKL